MSPSDAAGSGVRVVRTTGIYCRAGCPARPYPANTDRLPSVAAAEAAGYRACLRCRSDHLPVAALGDTRHRHIMRALDLISDGFLDRNREVDLASALGYSTRQLRRDFQQTLGATPSQVASSRRAHFARMLLDDTDLTVTEIAFAAGFGSLRRMNEVMRATFRFSPSQLRSKRARGDRSSVDGGIRLHLHVHREHRFEQYLHDLATRAVPGVECVESGRYRRAVSVCGHPGVVEVSSPRFGQVDIIAHVPALRGLIDVVAQCRRVFRLEHLDDGPPGRWSPFETGVVDIVRGGCRDADAVLARLVARHGTPVAGAASVGITHVFPTPHTLGGLSASEHEGLEPAVAIAITNLAILTSAELQSFA